MIKNKTMLKVRTDRQERVVRPSRYWDRAIDDRAYAFIPEGILAIAKNSTDFIKNESFKVESVPSNMQSVVYNFHTSIIEKMTRVGKIYTRYANKNFLSRFFTRRCAERQIRLAVNDLVNYTVKHAPAVVLYKVDRTNVVNFAHQSYYQFMLALRELADRVRDVNSLSDIPGLVDNAVALDAFYSNVGDQKFHNRVREELLKINEMVAQLEALNDDGVTNIKIIGFIQTMLEYIKYAEIRYSYQFGPGAQREHITEDLPFAAVGQAYVQTAATDITNRLTVLTHMGPMQRV